MSEPNKKSWGVRIIALTFIGIIVLGNLLLVLPEHIFKTRATSSCNACINNLRQIDAAVNQFALEHGLAKGSPINFPNDLTPYLKLNREGKLPPCPQGGSYYLLWVGQPPKCTLGLNITPAHVLP